jgi:hypothetical protein
MGNRHEPGPVEIEVECLVVTKAEMEALAKGQTCAWEGCAAGASVQVLGCSSPQDRADNRMRPFWLCKEHMRAYIEGLNMPVTGNA